MTKQQIKKKIAERMETIGGLEEQASNAGGCWESEKLGFTKGYMWALEVMLGNDEPNWDFMGK